jgi:predicted amidophosphoribosyltransferase
LRFLSKLSIVLVFIYPLVYLLGTVIGLTAVSQFTNLSFYIMLLSLAFLLIERSWLILMISCGAQTNMEIYLLISVLVRFRLVSINISADLCLFGALCVPSVLKFIAGYKATHVPKPKAPKPIKPAVSASYGKAAGSSPVCPKCGAAIQNPEAAFCNVCGSPIIKPVVSEKPETQASFEKCPVCGKAYTAPGAVFCNGCGTKRPQPEIAPVVASPEEPFKAPNSEDVNCEAAKQGAFAAPAADAAPAAVICPGCGIKCSPGASFCTDCGTPLRKTIAE